MSLARAWLAMTGVMYNKKEVIIGLLLGVLCFIFGYFQMAPGVVGVFHDDGIYISTAKALAEGQGYRLINLPDAPYQTKYPILYPLIMSIVWYIYPKFPSNIVVMQIINLFLTSLLIFFSYIYLVNNKYCSKEVALFSLLFCITFSHFLYFSTVLLSEMTFGLFLILALLFSERAPFDCHSKFHYVSFSLLLCLPYLTRTIGIIVIIFGIFWLIKNHCKKLVPIITSLAIIILWKLWTIYGNGAHYDQIINYYTNYYVWYYNYGLSKFIKVFFMNLLYFLYVANPINHYIFTINLDVPLIFNIFFLLFGLSIIIILFKDCYKSKLLPLFLIGYLGIILFWPWPPYRFIIPIMPLLYSLFWQDVYCTLRQRLPSLGGKAIAMGGVIIILSINGIVYVKNTMLNRVTNYPGFFHPKMNQERPDWREFEKLFQWIKSNTNEDDIIASGMDSLLYLYTNRKSIRPFSANPIKLFYEKHSDTLEDEEVFLKNLCKYNVKYLVLCPMYIFSEEEPFYQLVSKIRKAQPCLFKIVYQNDNANITIFELNIPPKIDHAG